MPDQTGRLQILILNRLRKELPDLLAVYRFGSSGTPFERSDSDLDLAVFTGRPLPVAELWYLSQELAALVKRDVDLIDLAAASTVMRAQVIGNGERIYCTDGVRCEIFEDYVYASYARLGEERREIIGDIRLRRHIYGR